MTKDDSLVVQNMELVRRIAQKVHRPLPAHIQLDDLIQDGMIGLLEAADRYDPDLNDSFPAYATPRIRGHIVDGIRSAGNRTRASINAHRSVQRAIHSIESTTYRPAREIEIAQVMCVPIMEVSRILAGAELGEILEYDELDDERFSAEGPAASRPDVSIETQDVMEALYAIVRKLSRKQRTVFIKYFIEGRRLRDIAASLGVCESRASQIKDELLEIVRSAMKEVDCFDGPSKPTKKTRRSLRSEP